MNPKVVANNDQPIKNIEKSSSPSIINFETLIARILKYWYVLVLSVIIGYFIGTALNRWYFSKIYSNYLTMNISANSSAQTNSASQSVNFFWGNTSENEVMLAKKELFSRTHNEKLVHEFNLFVKYKVQGRITSTNIDQEDSPYLVEIDKNHPQALYQEFTIEKISDTHFKVTFLKEKNNLTYNYSQEKYFHNIKDELPTRKNFKAK
jgi:succinoglycan biosynthesis transport protein ExoP